MSDKLVKNYTSDFVEYENVLSSKSEAKKIVAYVESDEDIAFWRNILHQYESADFYFEIQTPIKKGKFHALESRNEILDLTDQLGEFLIVCIDSDYDYLLAEFNAQSILINSSPSIFQTYTYSLENLLCFSNSLHPVCVQATKNDQRIVDFNELFKLYSRIIYKLFIWNLYFRKNNDHTTFTVAAFCELIKLSGKIDATDNFFVVLSGLHSRVNDKVIALEIAHAEALPAINILEADLRALGVNADQTYLFIHGHTLKENVVLMFLKPICQILTTAKFEHIKTTALNLVIEENSRNYYKKQKQDISAMLNANTEFKNCFLYQKIKADLDRYIADFKAAHT